MTYSIKISSYAEKKIKKLGATAEKQIFNYLKNVVAKLDNPTLLGKALVGNLSGKWRYRTGNYRIICKICNSELVVLVVDVSHRRPT
jgi:mRNA interferase RelE/StbE